MKKSTSAFISGASSRQGTEMRSAYSCASSPCSCATRQTFVACSSTPVRKNVSAPRCRWWRTSMSPIVVVYAFPIVGVALT
jgi:hypothetical protein